MNQQGLSNGSSFSVARFDTGALKDLMLVMATLVVVKQSVLLVSQLWGGPASTFTAMIVATFLLYRRGLSWADLGLRRPDSWVKTAGFVLVTVAAYVVAAGVMSEVADMFFEDVGASGRFDFVHDNLWGYLGVMVLVWTHAAFFEELLFRAFIINRCSAFLGGGLWADIIAAVFSAVFFGYRHYYYQGMNGALTTGAIGLAFALLYIWFGRRNLWPLVLSHGLMNSVAMTLRFIGVKAD